MAVGDIDGDGLEDVFFTGNQVRDRLYKNLGNLQFRDITEDSGIYDEEGWSTGVSMADVDSDGDLDIYVSRSASHNFPNSGKNRLYINDGQGRFTEESKSWGTDSDSYSTQAYFLDYDSDGDMDMYLLNHLLRVNSDQTEHWRNLPMDPLLSDRLYRNEGDRFEDVTASSGVMNQCWGLSASIEDFNGDRLPDIYVCNDFREGDLLYLNNGNGTFSEGLDKHFKHTSMYSMGSDAADINNDQLPDLIVADMSPSDHARNKQNMAAMSTEDFWSMADIGYHNQYMTNMLQLSRGAGQYSEVAQLAGLANTDWSWSTLMCDLDNDGWKDILVTNGIKKDVNDRDYKSMIEFRFKTGKPMSFDEVMQNWPSAKIANKVFRHDPDKMFVECGKEWGLAKAITSNGAAYADLDNDGDLDLVLNNMDEVASVFENKSSNPGITITLKGPGNNTHSVGSRLIFSRGDFNQSQYINASRGFQSSVSHRAHFALGNSQSGSLEIYWPDGMKSQLEIASDEKHLVLNYDSLEKTLESFNSGTEKSFKEESLSIYSHIEDDYDDYAQEVLLPQRMSALGPCIEAADLNGDGLEDLFIGSAKGSASKTFLQTRNGSFREINKGLWESSKETEDLGSLFFDCDDDGDQDLLVASGGNQDPLGQRKYPLRLFENDGKGNLKESYSIIKLDVSGMALAAGDIDGDGDMDLFVGGRQIPGSYGLSPRSYILENVNGKYLESLNHHPTLKDPGMVTSAQFSDLDGDGALDLIIAGEWMSPTVFFNRNGTLSEMKSMEDSNGWWYSLVSSDMDGDGDEDLVAGNLGLEQQVPSE